MASAIKFLTGSNAKDISLFSFQPETKTITHLKANNIGPTPSWIEHSTDDRFKGKVFYSLSEQGGKAMSLKLEEDGTVEITGTGTTTGNSAHCLATKDGKGVVATNYMGGSAAYFPIDQTTGALATSVLPSTIESTLLPSVLQTHPPILTFPFTYATSPENKTSILGSPTGPNAERQETSHPHQCVEGPDGRLYVPDLGGDRIHIIERREREDGKVVLDLKNELQVPPGAGPRHMVFSKDGKHIYVLTELAHAIFIFATPDASSTSPASPIHPTGTQIIPPVVPNALRPKMDAGEIILSPISPRTLYASNRGQVGLDPEEKEPKVTGDAVAIVTLTEGGDAVESVDWLQTGTNFIRGMGITDDGKYLGVAGQKDGSLEVYEVSGERGEVLTKVARLEGKLELPTDFLWI